MRGRIKEEILKAVQYGAEPLVNKEVNIVELVGQDTVFSYGGLIYQAPNHCVEILREVEPSVPKPKDVRKRAEAKKVVAAPPPKPAPRPVTKTSGKSK